ALGLRLDQLLGLEGGVERGRDERSHEGGDRHRDHHLHQGEPSARRRLAHRPPAGCGGRCGPVGPVEPVGPDTPPGPRWFAGTHGSPVCGSIIPPPGPGRGLRQGCPVLELTRPPDACNAACCAAAARFPLRSPPGPIETTCVTTSRVSIFFPSFQLTVRWTSRTDLVIWSTS